MKDLPIRIMSRQAAENAIPTETTMFMISISDVGSPLPNIKASKLNRGCIQMQFDDVYEDEPNAMTAAQAKELVGWIEYFFEHIQCEQMWVHCEAGVSRSAAIAAATARCLFGDDTSIFANPNFYPNKHVYLLMCKAFGNPVDEEEWFQKHHLNITEWRKLQDAL